MSYVKKNVYVFFKMLNETKEKLPSKYYKVF